MSVPRELEWGGGGGGCYFWVGARRGWVGPRRGWGKRRGEARRSLKLTRGLRRGYKNVKKQPTGLSKEVRWALLEGGAGLGRGLIPLSSEHLHSLHRILSKFVSGKVVIPKREWTGFWVLGAPGAGPGGSSGAPEIARVRLLGTWHCQLPKVETSTGHLGQPLL